MDETRPVARNPGRRGNVRRMRDMGFRKSHQFRDRQSQYRAQMVLRSVPRACKCFHNNYLARTRQARNLLIYGRIRVKFQRIFLQGATNETREQLQRFWRCVIALVGLVSVIPSAGSANIFAAQKNSSSLQKAAKADLSGKWDLSVSTDGGPVSAKAEFKVASGRNNYWNCRVCGIWLVDDFQGLGDGRELRD